MPTWNPTASLEDLEARLRALERVPPRAERFHRTCRDLIAEIGSRLRRWWRPWISDAHLERLRERLTHLEEVAAGVTRITAEAVDLEDKLAALLERAEYGGEPEVLDWLEGRCRPWKAALANVGSETDRPSDLPSEQARLEELRSEIDLHDACLEAFFESRRTLRTAAAGAAGVDPLQAAPLQAELKDLCHRLLDEGASSGWLDAVRQQLGPLAQMVSHRPEPPPTVQTVQSRLADLHRWSRVLDRDPRDLDELTQRCNLAATEWTGWRPEEIDDLLASTEGLLKRLRDEARQLRRDRLGELKSRIHSLVQAHRHHPELEENLQKLEEASVDQPQHHRRWNKEWSDLRHRFEAVATSQEEPLRQRLGSQLSGLHEVLRPLTEIPLTANVREKKTALGWELERLAELREAVPVLGGLGRVEALRREIEGLVCQAQEENEAFETARRRLETRRQALAAAWAESGLTPLEADAGGEETGAPETAIDPDPSHGVDLDQARDRLAAEEAIQQRREAEFLSASTHRLTEDLEIVRRTEEGLARAGLGETPSTEVPVPPLQDEEELVARARQLAAAATLRHSAETRLEEALRTLEEQRQQQLADLEALADGSLRPEERQTGQRLLEELRGSGWGGGASAPLERLQRSTAQLADGELFLAGLARDERQIRHRRRELRHRLQDLRREQLGRYFPELADRAEGLIHGLPERPRRWGDARAQLDQADALLTRLETQGRRQAAAELESAAAALRWRCNGFEPPRGDLERLLAELDAQGVETLPPLELRRRVLTRAG